MDGQRLELAFRWSMRILFASLGIVVIADASLLNQELLIQPVLDFAGSNEASLSVIISGLLFVAYVFQFRSHALQRRILSNQEDLMQAGFTPIVGVSSLSYARANIGRPDYSSKEANEVKVDLVNNGNSTAKDIRLQFCLKYACKGDSQPNLDYAPCEVPLTRSKEGTWWPSDIGGAISNSEEESVEFTAHPKVKRVSTEWKSVLGLQHQRSDIQPVHQALSDLDNCSQSDDEVTISEFQLLVVLKYNTTNGVSHSVPLTVTKGNPSKIGDKYELYSGTDMGDKKAKELYQQEGP